MSPPPADPSGSGAAEAADAVAPTGRRRPEQLLLAFLGELVVDRGLGPVPTSELIPVLADLGVGEAATRATLTRMAGRGLLAPVRDGRTVAYGLTPHAERVLREARDRVFAADPFAPRGAGWTLVTFSVPESRRDVRHRVRAQLAWAGFGLLRDGLWIAPGEVDVAQALGEVREDDGGSGDGPDRGANDGPDDGLELVAFRAHEVPGFSVARSIRATWGLDEARARHDAFQARWAHVAAQGDGARAIRDVTALVADWLDLLRAVPRLPTDHLPPDWPAAGSTATFRRLHAALAEPARAELAQRLRPDVGTVPHSTTS